MLGNANKPLKAIQDHIVSSAKSHVATEPVGVRGEGAIAFGAGAAGLSGAQRELLKEVDPSQFVEA